MNTIDGLPQRLLGLKVVLVAHLAKAARDPLVGAQVDVAVAAGVVRPGQG